MGIDLLVITLRIEEVFHLRIDNEFFESLFNFQTAETPESVTPRHLQRWDELTVGQFVNEITQRLKLAGWYEEQRPLDITLQELLRKLRTHYGREDISPDTTLVSFILPKPDFRDWEEFTQLLPAKLPDLIVRGPWMHPCRITALVGLVTGLIAGWLFDRVSVAVLVGFIVALVAFPVLDFRRHRMSQNPNCRRIPTEIETVQKLAEFLGPPRVEGGLALLWNEQSVWKAVQTRPC